MQAFYPFLHRLGQWSRLSSCHHPQANTTFIILALPYVEATGQFVGIEGELQVLMFTQVLPGLRQTSWQPLHHAVASFSAPAIGVLKVSKVSGSNSQVVPFLLFDFPGQ